MLKSLLISAGLASTMVFAPAAEAAGQQRPFPVIILQCPSDSTEATALCHALRDALEVKAPHHLVRLGQAPASLDADHIALTLTLHNQTSVSLEGQLSWREGLSKDIYEGPALSMTSLDSRFPASILKQFAANLLAASPDLLPAS